MGTVPDLFLLMETTVESPGCLLPAPSVHWPADPGASPCGPCSLTCPPSWELWGTHYFSLSFFNKVLVCMALPGFLASGELAWSAPWALLPAAGEDGPQCLDTVQLLPGVLRGRVQIHRVERHTLPPPAESLSSHIKGRAYRDGKNLFPFNKICLMKKSAVCSAWCVRAGDFFSLAHCHPLYDGVENSCSLQGCLHCKVLRKCTSLSISDISTRSVTFWVEKNPGVWILRSGFVITSWSEG